MEKSFVGDPVHWPGLVYSPLNNSGLIYTLGTIAGSIGLLFEEFAADSNTAVCRRKTDAGWERLKVAFTFRTSAFVRVADDVDLLICWLDDSREPLGIPLLVLSEMGGAAEGKGMAMPRPLESILPESAAEDLLERARNRESYEETVRQLDEQIKKLQDR
jgi:hypothetical protein